MNSGGESPIKLVKPSNDDPVAWADWLEAAMIILGKRHASRAWIRIALKNDVFPESGLGTADLDSDEIEGSIDGLIAEVERRRGACTEAYPFAVGSGLTHGVTFESKTPAVTYVFLLLISVSLSMREEKRHREVDRTFDLVVLEALKGYLGPGSTGLRFGVPASGGRPKGFGKAVEWLAAALHLPRGSGTTRGHAGDGGVDVVAWLPFQDTREGFLTVLGQCTVQMNWHYKAKDIALGQWIGWIDFGLHPATCLAVPFAIPASYERWDEVRRTAVVVLERTRLTSLVRVLPNNLNKEVLGWVRREIIALGASSTDHISGWAA